MFKEIYKYYLAHAGLWASVAGTFTLGFGLGAKPWVLSMIGIVVFLEAVETYQPIKIPRDISRGPRYRLESYLDDRANDRDAAIEKFKGVIMLALIGVFFVVIS